MKPAEVSSECARGGAEREFACSKPTSSGFSESGGGGASAGIVEETPARVFRYHSRPRGFSSGITEVGSEELATGYSVAGEVVSGCGLFRDSRGSGDDHSEGTGVFDLLTNRGAGAESENWKSSPAG